MRVLLLTPPMTQLNTPYPATAYLTGFLRQEGVDAVQADPAIELVLRLFSRKGVQRVTEALPKEGLGKSGSRSVAFFLKNRARYEECVEPAIHFLQGKDPTLALRIAGRQYLPEGPRFKASAEDGELLDWAFGGLGVQDRAKFLASLFIDDLADVIREGIDPKFELSRYAEKLAASAPSFAPLQAALEGPPTLVDSMLEEISAELFDRVRPELVAITLPFPGNVYGGLRIARKLKSLRRDLPIALGGGFVNTELRGLSEPGVFRYVDYVTLDDGERPLLNLIQILEGKRPRGELFRTFLFEDGKVAFKSDPRQHDIPHSKTGTPSYAGLPLGSYLSIFEMLNPMHRIWSDGRWNKLTLAHGCYWHKCSFCDVTLDYIGRYDPASADLLVDRIERIIAETGQSGFHFVDEAAPPAVLRGLAERLIARGVTITWWGNIRFEKAFTPELCELLARSGCVAVSGGLEVASDRLLKLMEKGVTVEQVARVTRAFTDAGVMVHVYLMYGFPTETEQETIDSLERVRQLFEAGCIQSAYWHRFSVTAHSPIGRDPAKYGIRLHREPEVKFARNDLAFEDPAGVDHDRLGIGLRKALYNYMHGIGYESDVRFWFSDAGLNLKKLPAPKVAKDLIARAIEPEPKRAKA